MSKGKGSHAFDVFVSYGHEDAKFVNVVLDHLESFNLNIWFDRQSMVYGQRISDAIHEGIRSSPVILVFISHHSVESPWVSDEINAALALERNNRAKVVPVFLGRIADDKIPGGLKDRYGLDLRYNFQKRWMEEGGKFTDFIVRFAKGENIAPRALLRDSDMGPSFSATDMARLYDFPLDLDGAGQCVGIVELGGGYRETDLEAYMMGLGLPLPKITSVSVDGGRNSPEEPGASAQVAADLQVIAAIAPRADIVVYFAPPTDRGFREAILAAAGDDTHNPGVLCTGWGLAEPSWNRESVTRMEEALAAAAARGITVCCAAGDSGPTDGVTDGKAHVDFPASSPHVLACGGTQITVKERRIETEAVWNDYPDGGVTGGGFSEIFPVPAWQEDVFAPDLAKSGKHSGRGLPDVAVNASPLSGYRILINGKQMVIGGTNAAAPLWAGLITLMNQGVGQRVGFLNPVLYRDLGPAGILRDITEGSTQEGEQADLGHKANAGWDPCTGWGVPNGERLLGALKMLQITRHSEHGKT